MPAYCSKPPDKPAPQAGEAASTAYANAGASLHALAEQLRRKQPPAASTGEDLPHVSNGGGFI